MPYPSYAKLTDEDVKSLYDFFMHQVPAAHVPNKPNEIRAIFSLRWPLAVWDWIFVKNGAFTPDPKHDAAWNRGAYLVEGLGHCSACHTPRGIAFQEKALDSTNSTFLSGASLDGWSATSLRGEMRTGLGPWSHADLVSFLKTGHNRFGSAFGSMTDVINNSTPYLNDADIDAMATYIKSLPANEMQQPHAYDNATTEVVQKLHVGNVGATVYAGRCATCHGQDGKGYAPFMPPVAGNPTVMDNDPESLINLVLNGSVPLVVKGTPDAYRMPQFRVTLGDDEIAEVVNFIRTGWGNKASMVTADDVAKLRKSTDPTSDNVIILKMR
ncbi:c-type cytochrome [Bradyrhizobium elkanii]|uniref:c-type cytochrome n=1 Tax=Bradyrhizobium elkanii TaxID=29448 RepID=UPI0004BB134B|nr:cytochrome c [Bradyrhizobium elkanii]